MHAAVVGLLLVLGGPVWESERPRIVTRLTLPPRLAPLIPPPVLRRPAIVPLPVPAAAREAILLPRPTVLPTPFARPAPLRIEAPLEVAPVAVTIPLPMPIPLPKLVVKPAVQVGLLDSSTDTARTAAPPSRTLSGPSGFDSGGQPAKVGRRLASVGFDESSSTAPAVARRTMSSGGFDSVESSAARPTAKVVTTPFEGIEILEKPRPVYTEEARRLRIEGTVQLRVVFGAAGQIRVVGVVKGLGHGLDEAAVQAAEAIRFRPARRDGRPVDAPALIQIQFQIA